MAYVILELQTDASGSTAAPPLKTEKEYNKAVQSFHQTAAAAAVSSVPVHTVVLLNETGVVDNDHKEVFVHTQEPEITEGE